MTTSRSELTAAKLDIIRRHRKREILPNPAQYNENIRNGWMPFWAPNSRRNGPIIEADFGATPAPDAAKIMTLKDGDDRRCFVIGSGPSLDDALPHLVNWKGTIFCSSSQLTVLEAWGITPTYCVIIDADPTMSFLVKDADTRNITLVTHPCMDPEILKAWQGPRLYFRMSDPGDMFFGEVLPLMYSRLNDRGESIDTFVLNSGCVVNTAAALARGCGYQTIFLAGVDFGFPGDVYRFSDYKRVGDAFEKIPDPGIPESRKTFLGTEDIWADTVGVFYKYSMLVLYGIDRANLISCSRGILKELPYCTPEDAVAGNEPPEVPDEEKYRVAREYLRIRGIYINRRRPQELVLHHDMKRYRKLRKIVARYTAFMEWVRGRPVLPMLRVILRSNRVRVNLRKFGIEILHTETRIGWKEYLQIQNVAALPKWRRPWFKIRQFIGRKLGAW